MSLQKRRLNEIKDLRWIEMRKEKRLKAMRKEQNQSKTSTKKKAQEKNQGLDRERSR